MSAARAARAHVGTRFDADPPMTEADYQAQLAALDAERAALEQTYITSQIYPRWAYHATEPARLIASDAEALALGPGWSPTPVPVAPPVAVAPVVTALMPDTAVLGSPSFTLRVLGEGFTADAMILWNATPEPTTVVSDTEVTTGVDMTTATVAIPIPVAVQQASGTSAALAFTFTAAAAVADAPSGRKKGRS